jgi:alcohol dehydrogenase class IV
MAFEFATATKILFGAGSIAALPAQVRALGERALIVSGRSAERCSSAADALIAAGIEVSLFGVEGEPTVDAVRWGSKAASVSADVVIGFGGGSAIDAAKAIAALATNDGDVLDYLEVVGQGKPLERAPLPFIAVPTTAGTGSEVTRNAVLGSPEHGVKASLRSPLMLAKAAIIDPELTYDLPPSLTASTGLDALTQLIEPYVSARANAMVDLFCLEGMRRVAVSLRRAYHDGNDREARESMSFASLLGGLSLANAGLGVVHGFAAPVGGMFEAPHGAVCAAVLPHGMAVNIRALGERAPDSIALGRYREIAKILTGQPNATAEDGVAWVRELCAELSIPPLGAYGIATDHVPHLVEKAAQASSMKANPLVLTCEELTEVLSASL